MKTKKRQQPARGRRRSAASKTLKPTPAPARPGELDWREWNFVSVPDSELVACCHYEYARESVAIRSAVKRAKVAQVSLGKPLPVERVHQPFIDAVNQAYALLHHTGFDLSFWLRLPFHKPWLDVDKDERAKWAHVCPAMPVAVKIPAFGVTGDYFIVSELYNLAHQANEKRKAAWARVMDAEKVKELVLAKGANGEGVDAAKLHLADKNIAELLTQAKQDENPCPISFMGGGGVQTLVAQINWRDYTKPEIKAAMRQWVEANTPKTIPEPSERGHKPIDWRNKLRALGIMRLMKRTAFGNMKIRQSAAWELYRNWKETQWYADQRRASKHFRTLLPFLPEGELPLHANTKHSRAAHAK